MPVFFLIFFLTNILFSAILCSLIIRLDRDSNYSSMELLLYSLGLGPAFLTLLLYYSFLLIPGRSSLFYVSIVIVVFSAIALAGRQFFNPLYRDLTDNFRASLHTFNRLSVFRKVEKLFFLSVIMLPLSYYLFCFVTVTLQHPFAIMILSYTGPWERFFFLKGPWAQCGSAISLAQGFRILPCTPPLILCC